MLHGPSNAGFQSLVGAFVFSMVMKGVAKEKRRHCIGCITLSEIMSILKTDQESFVLSGTHYI